MENQNKLGITDRVNTPDGIGPITAFDRMPDGRTMARVSLRDIDGSTFTRWYDLSSLTRAL